MAPKLRQIQKFVEVLEGLVLDADAQDRRHRLKGDANIGESASTHSSTSQTRPLNLRDFGCGRGYLTFAAHAHFASATTATASSDTQDIEDDTGRIGRRSTPTTGRDGKPSQQQQHQQQGQQQQGQQQQGQQQGKQQQQPLWAVTTVGVELRRDLVQETNKIARGLGPGIFEGLRFEEAAIADYVHAQSTASIGADEKIPGVPTTTESGLGNGDNDNNDDEEEGGGGGGEEESKESEGALLPPLEVLVALHACDTATDDALWAGLQGGAHVIVTAPCCHKEVRKQLNAASSSLKGEGSEALHPLADVLRFGTLRERHAEMATDAVTFYTRRLGSSSCDLSRKVLSNLHSIHAHFA